MDEQTYKKLKAMVKQERELKYNSFGKCGVEVVRKVDDPRERLLTGIPEVDSLTNGLRTGLNVIAGFRKCCKSTFANNLIYKALNEGKNVCLLSLEMGRNDVIFDLLSLHSYELDPIYAVTREEMQVLYKEDREKYDDYLHSFLSLPGKLVIVDEKDISKSDYSKYDESNFNEIFEKINSYFDTKTQKETNVLVIDNINCIKYWGKSYGEQACTMACDYFRRISKSFGGGNPVIVLLLCQINRSGGKTAMNMGFYPESCIAETVNIERDCESIISIFVDSELAADNVARIKLDTSRHSASMTDFTEIPINLPYGKIGYPLIKVNVDEEVKNLLKLANHMSEDLIKEIDEKLFEEIDDEILFKSGLKEV